MGLQPSGNRSPTIRQMVARKLFQIQLGQTTIEKIQIPLKSRDEMPPILAGLQWIFLTPEVNEAVFQVLEKKLQGGKKQTGRPGMDLWHILVLGVTRLGLDCDFDRLEYHANFDSLLREILDGTFACVAHRMPGMVQ
jgi:transposase, IS5 family